VARPRNIRWSASRGRSGHRVDRVDRVPLPVNGLGQLDAPGVAVAFVLMTAGIIAFVASSALFALPRSRRG
jgi:hypothetical protein